MLLSEELLSGPFLLLSLLLLHRHLLSHKLLLLRLLLLLRKHLRVEGLMDSAMTSIAGRRDLTLYEVYCG